MQSERQIYRLRDRGSDLAVEVWFDGRNEARLLVDDEPVDEGDAEEIGQTDLTAPDGRRVRVSWWWKGRVRRCVLVEQDSASDVNSPAGRKEHATSFEPPSGTRAHRQYEWADAHPNLYAARHAAGKVIGTVAVVLGIGALIRAFLSQFVPRISLDWVPDIASPDWLNAIVEWIGDAIAWLFGWLPDITLPSGPWVRLATAILIGVGIGVQEVRRRKARDRREAELARPGDRPDGTPRGGQESE